jgi:Uncharacterized conserved protein
MLLAALLDTGLVTVALEKELAAIPPFSAYRLAWQKASSSTARATVMDAAAPLLDTTLTLAEWKAVIQETSVLPPTVQTAALATVERLDDAYVAMHGQVAPLTLTALEMAETCALLLARQQLHIQTIYCSALPLLPQTSPVVIEIARRADLVWQVCNDIEPRPCCSALGVAVLATLVTPGEPTMQIEHVGYGLDASLQRQALSASSPYRALGLYIAHEITRVQRTAAVVQDAEHDQVVVLETNIDNMSGELLGGLMERLFSAGALDVTYTPIQMKKERPATMVTVISPLQLGEELALLLLRETSTLGVRTQLVSRRKAQRAQVRIQTALGSALVKVKRLGGELISAAPEYEECQRLAHEHGLPLLEVYEIVRDAIRHSDELTVE